MKITDLHIHDGNPEENSKAALELLLHFLEFNAIAEVIMKNMTEGPVADHRTIASLQQRAQQLNELIAEHPLSKLSRHQMTVHLAIESSGDNISN